MPSKTGVGGGRAARGTASGAHEGGGARQGNAWVDGVHGELCGRQAQAGTAADEALWVSLVGGVESALPRSGELGEAAEEHFCGREEREPRMTVLVGVPLEELAHPSSRMSDPIGSSPDSPAGTRRTCVALQINPSFWPCARLVTLRRLTQAAQARFLTRRSKPRCVSRSVHTLRRSSAPKWTPRGSMYPSAA
jgi:hypothetical protein